MIRSAAPNRARPTTALALLALAILFQGCGGEVTVTENPGAPTEEQRAALLARSEELILQLSPQLSKLGEALEHGGMINPGTRKYFADTVVRGPTLKPGAAGTITELPLDQLVQRTWPISGEKATAIAADDLLLWQAFFQSIGTSIMQEAHFHIVNGEFLLGATDQFETEVEFEGVVQDPGNGIWSIGAKQRITWQQPDPAGHWQITGWSQSAFQTTHAPSPLFREVLGEALLDETSLQHARRSYHEEHVVDLFTKDSFQVRSTNKLYAKYTDIEGLFQHPALSVVDVDRDGHDDLYVMGRWGKNQLLRNRGDGTFEDIAAAVGLDIEGFCNCAVFADFDNDGDPDAFIGRSLERGLYLENQDGLFVDRSKDLVSAPLPHLISSISAADYNGDGLLDVYLSLYGPSSRTHSVKTWAADFFPPQMVAAMEKRESDSHTYLERFGPPNLLLVNRGTGFAVAPEAAQLAEWLNTFQCSWSDYDNDGDQDAYVCNDFAPDHLFRNDGKNERGIVKFTEVSEQLAGSAMQGFGMGASWGDYDGDGELDLYVSNMYSKAGKRISAAFDGLDERIAYSASGSLLFHNEGEHFRQVAGTASSNLQVAKVGWSWGGQLVDLDNDGWLDIHAVSGFYTAPEELAPEKDL
ncbi:MAG: hypothetical protein ACI9UA_001628 [Pseudoalteromonas tetraodonis]